MIFEYICYALQLFGALAVICIAFYKTIKTQSFYSGFWYFYGLLCLWAIFFGLAFPIAALYFDDDTSVFKYVPEGPAVVIMIAMGWIYAIVFVGTIRILHACYLRFFAK